MEIRIRVRELLVVYFTGCVQDVVPVEAVYHLIGVRRVHNEVRQHILITEIRRIRLDHVDVDIAVRRADRDADRRHLLHGVAGIVQF